VVGGPRSSTAVTPYHPINQTTFTCTNTLLSLRDDVANPARKEAPQVIITEKSINLFGGMFLAAKTRPIK
jgi:hypothetical protein